jgi:NADH-quinone oxidoreductase subunit H
MGYALFSILIFPGLLFLSMFGMFAEFADRKLYARLQNRVGPPWYQPQADFIKLLSKEEIVPDDADHAVFKVLPAVALTGVLTSSIYIPLWTRYALFSFEGDAIVVLYLLTLPTLSFFLAGWYSSSLFPTIGAVRVLTQLFAYEVPLFMAILGPAIVAGSWSLSGVARFYGDHLGLWIFNLPGFVVAVVALQGKLERLPFDIPEAETEIVGGSLTEYGGRLLAFFRLAIDVELVVGAALLAAVFLPFGLGLPAGAGFVLWLLKVLCIVALLAVIRTVMARLRIDQMVEFCWKYLATAAIFQVLIDLAVKGVMAG